MKKTILLSAIVLSCVFSLMAQAPPQAFNYSSVIRGSNGQALPNKVVALQFTILSGSPLGNVEYQETHLDTTDQWGVVNLAIGTGTIQQGNFASIDWGINTYYLQVELDENGGTNFQMMGTLQLLSVPYALYAGNVNTSSINTGYIFHTRGPLLSANDSTILKYSSGFDPATTHYKEYSFLVPRDGQLTNFFATPTKNALAAGSIVTIKVLLNGVATQLSLTFTDTDGFNTKSDTTTVIDINQGDFIAIQYSENGGVIPGTFFQASIELK